MSQFVSSKEAQGSLAMSICKELDPDAVAQWVKVNDALFNAERRLEEIVGNAAKPLIKIINRKIEAILLELIEKRDDINMTPEAENELLSSLSSITKDAHLIKSIVATVMKAQVDKEVILFPTQLPSKSSFTDIEKFKRNTNPIETLTSEKNITSEKPFTNSSKSDFLVKDEPEEINEEDAEEFEEELMSLFKQISNSSELKTKDSVRQQRRRASKQKRAKI